MLRHILQDGASLPATNAGLILERGGGNGHGSDAITNYQRALSAQEAEEELPAPSEAPFRAPLRSDEGSGPAAPWVPREGTKQALVLSLLSRPEGATIDDLLSAIGWLAHTTRAALTGLRHKGYEFLKSRNQAGETVYRTAPMDGGKPVPRDVKAGEGLIVQTAPAAQGEAA